MRSARPPQARGRREWEHARHDVENPSSSRAGGDGLGAGPATSRDPFLLTRGGRRLTVLRRGHDDNPSSFPNGLYR